MATLTQGKNVLEFLLSEGNGQRSREAVVVTQSGAALASGTVLGKITASGKFVPYAPGASDGSENAVAVLIPNLPAATGDVRAAVIARDAEVKSSMLTGRDTAGDAELAAVGIIAR